jgi:hypothetical protein
MFGSPLSRPPLEVTVDSPSDESNLAFRTPWKKRSRVRSWPASVVRKALAPTERHGFPAEASLAEGLGLD